MGTSVRDDRWKTSGISRGSILESDPMDALENNLRNAMAELQEETEGIVVFADLLGGSPFKAAMLVLLILKMWKLLWEQTYQC